MRVRACVCVYFAIRKLKSCKVDPLAACVIVMVAANEREEVEGYKSESLIPVSSRLARRQGGRDEEMESVYHTDKRRMGSRKVSVPCVLVSTDLL